MLKSKAVNSFFTFCLGHLIPSQDFKFYEYVDNSQIKIVYLDLTPEIQKHICSCFLGHWVSHWHLTSTYLKWNLYNANYI